jgi:hypothetical protein
MPYFTFKIDNQITFRTQVQSLQCQDTAKTGKQCKRRSVIGSPYCSAHLAYKHHLKIEESNITNAGKGLFAVDPLSSNPNDIIFKKGSNIVEYTGEIINGEELNDRYQDKTAPYTVQLNKDKFIDGAKIRGVGSLANTKPNHNNATISVYRSKASIKASKNIKNGDEIYLSYGRSYRLKEPGVSHETTKR